MLRLFILHFRQYPRIRLLCAAAFLALIALAFVGVHLSEQSKINSRLYAGVASRDVEAVRVALELGADPNMLADARGQNSALSKSLCFWRDRKPDSHFAPILMAALSWPDRDVYKPYPANDQDYMPALAKRTRQQTPQMLAIVLLLLKHGAHIDAEDNNGRTALSIASADATPSIVACLLDHGAYVDHLNHDQSSPLFEAADSMETSTVRLLLQRGARPNTQTNSFKWTPLMMAVMDNDEEMATLLLKAGADVTLRDRDGNRVLTYKSIKSFSPETKHLMNASIKKFYRK